MASPLRFTLTSLCLGAMLIIYLPLFPALWLLLRPAFFPDNWALLASDPQLIQAVTATLVSTGIAVSGALIFSLLIITALWPSVGWQRLTSRLPLLLALPHVAFATCALLLFAEGGSLYRYLPFIHPVQDKFGVGLGLVLAVKECGFLLWASWALLGDPRLAGQAVVLKSLGYGRGQCLFYLILPTLMPALGMVLLATTAWTLSVVDVAIILGPGNPPTLAVLAWQWLNQGDDIVQAKGELACILLLGLLAFLALGARLFWGLWQRIIPGFNGRRYSVMPLFVGHIMGWSVPLSGLICTLVLLIFAHTTLPDATTFNNSFWLATGSTLLGAVLCLLWLEWGPRRASGWVWLPLILPALPLAAGQYQLALYGWVDGAFTTVLWGHLLWVVPWMLFILRPAWQRIDPRQVLIARTLGWRPLRVFMLVKCPLIVRPLLSAMAIGFSVSIAQYLPTQWLGAGRISTLTTEAVALSSGGSTSQLAAQALWQLLLPVLFFTFTALLARSIGHYRQGLR
jgi:ABC-type uncharacterized transport system, permease component